MSPRRKLRPLQLAAIIFLTVSGGPYRLEPLLNDAGGDAALLLLRQLLQFSRDVPTIFVMLWGLKQHDARNGRLLHQWVKRALGMRFAFYEGWWTWLYTFADLAIYPVLFVQYLSFSFSWSGSL